MEAYRSFRLRMRDQVGSEPSGETTCLYREIREAARQSTDTHGSRGAIARGSGISERPKINPLPHPVSSLIGREEAIREVRIRIQENRLVTLIGGGGVGKTRLAIEAARLAEDDSIIAAWVELAPVTDDSLVLPALAEALGVRQEGNTDADSLLSRIATGLSDKSMLVVLDNCEHLLDTVGNLVLDLLTRCAGLRVLATSRQRLAISGEVTWRVPSLDVTNPDDLPTHADAAIETAMATPAAQLFIERGSAANSGFKLLR